MPRTVLCVTYHASLCCDKASSAHVVTLFSMGFHAKCLAFQAPHPPSHFRRHCDITAFHYSTVINACGRAGDWPRAVQLIVAMGARAVQPDTIVYNSAISACARGSWPQALQLLEMLTGAVTVPRAFRWLVTNSESDRSTAKYQRVPRV